MACDTGMLQGLTVWGVVLIPGESSLIGIEID